MWQLPLRLVAEDRERGLYLVEIEWQSLKRSYSARPFSELSGALSRLRHGYGGPPELYAEAEGGPHDRRFVRTWSSLAAVDASNRRMERRTFERK